MDELELPDGFKPSTTELAGDTFDEHDSENMDELELPDGFKPLTTQVAGHTFQHDTKEIGMLQDDSSAIVLKPLGKPACGACEYNFYEKLKNTHETLRKQLKKFVPFYHCRLKLFINNNDLMFLKLENLAHNITMPCIMDIKIGKRTWDPLATPQKRAVEEQKYSSCKQTLGLCVPGFQVYQLSDNNLIRHSKEYGKKLKAAEFCETMALFLNLRPKVCMPFIREVLRQLYEIRDWFRVQTLYHFYASSLLIIYDFEQLLIHLKQVDYDDAAINAAIDGYNTLNMNGDDHAQTADVETNKQKLLDPSNWVRVRMIDFAHVFPAENETLDTNYLFGLESLIHIIEKYLPR